MAVPTASINHVGLSVPNIEKAIQFYQEVMGWYHIAGPFPIKNDGGPSAKFTDTIYGHEGHAWTGFRLAHMTAANGIGIELLEFEGSHDPELEFDYKEHGVFHYAITVPDVEEFVERFTSHGGTQYSDYNIRKISDVNTITTVFVRDPFGIVFEVHSHSYEYMNRML